MKSMVAANHWHENSITPPTWGDTVYVSWRPDMPVVLTR
ncbi:MAG: TOBE domain-containing protein [Vogesella sp.]